MTEKQDMYPVPYVVAMTISVLITMKEYGVDNAALEDVQALVVKAIEKDEK